MRRKKTPWALRKRSGSKNWYCRFHFRGELIERTTGAKLESEANKIAAVIYTDVVTGRTRSGAPSAKDASTTVEDLGVLWLDSISNTVVPRTLKGYGIHLRHIQDYFGVVANLSSAESEKYVNFRLGKVQRPTVMKEKATLQALVNWAKRHGHLAETFRVPPIKKNVIGTKFEKRRRGNATPLSAEEADKIVDRLPEWSMTRTEEAFPVRSRIKFMRETGFRPSMVDTLSMPEHYRPGEKTVYLERRTNKGRVDRDIPLTQAAMEALETARCGRDTGLIFGQHACRLVLKAAAIGVIDETRRARLTQEDFRHKRLTEFAETGNPVGASYLAGHTNTETIKHYAKPERQAADKVLAAVDPRDVEDAEDALEELEAQEAQRAFESQEAIDTVAELDAIVALNQKNMGSDMGSRLSAQVEQPAEPVAPKEKPPELPGVTSSAQGRTRTGTPLLALAPEASASANSATWAVP
jgi:integrase